MDFTEMVERRLRPEEEAVKELWRPLADRFERDGPEAVQGFLSAERQRLEERVRHLLSEFEER